MSTTISIVVGFLGGSLSTFVIQKLISSISTKKDSQKVIVYINSQIPQRHDWITTRNISSNTNLTPARVEEICSNHPGIKMSTGSKEGMWTIRTITGL